MGKLFVSKQASSINNLYHLCAFPTGTRMEGASITLLKEMVRVCILLLIRMWQPSGPPALRHVTLYPAQHDQRLTILKSTSLA